MTNPEHCPDGTGKPITAYLWGVLTVLTCPCHLPILAATLAGTTAQLAQAAKRGQLELHYQPIVDLNSDRISGAEALLRWRHPSLGMLPPSQFLAGAESSGLMPEIGAWVLSEACRQMHADFVNQRRGAHECQRTDH